MEKPFKEIVKKFYLNNGSKTFPYGIGAGYYGRKIDSKTIRKEKIALETAYHSGFRYYDTSSDYDSSEIRLGEFISDIKRKDIFLATKFPISDIAGSVMSIT